MQLWSAAISCVIWSTLFMLSQGKNNLQVHYFYFTFLLGSVLQKSWCTYLQRKEPKDSRVSLQSTGHCEIRFLASKPCILQFPTVRWIYCTAPDLSPPGYGRTVHLQINHFLARKNSFSWVSLEGHQEIIKSYRL